MGTLVAMAYPTSLFAKLADHTYVKCANGGAAWGCWGGKSGGRVLRSGRGSTRRADKIARPDEKANIRCYLVNGVCHQAANRILLPASVTVRGARGYPVSQALFGTYGQVGFWPCRSPFNQYPGVTGDLAACIQAKPHGGRRRPDRALSDADKLDYQFIREELAIYKRGAQLLRSGVRSNAQTAEARKLHVELFMHMAEFHLGPMLDGSLARNLKGARAETESARSKLQAAYGNGEMGVGEYADRFDELTLSFQTEMANRLSRDAYVTLFGLEPEDQVVLADPRIVRRVARG